MGAAKLRQRPASVLSLSAKLIAHIGSFCDEATCRAASEAHNCFTPIHHSSAEHTWDGTGNTTTAAWFGRDEDRGPRRDMLRWRRQFLPLAERFVALLQRKPCLETLRIIPPGWSRCSPHKWYTSCIEALALIAGHVEVRLQRIGGTTPDTLAVFRTATERTRWAVAAAAAEASDQPWPQLPDGLWPPEVVDSPGAEAWLGGLVSSVVRFAHRVHLTRAGAGDAGSAAVPLQRARLMLECLSAQDIFQGGLVTAVQWLEVVDVDRLSLYQPSSREAHAEVMQALCQVPDLPQAVHTVCFDCWDRDGGHWHSTTPQQRAALASIPEVVLVAHMDVDGERLPPHPLLMHCTTEIVVALTSLTQTANLARLCSHAARLRRVTVVRVMDEDRRCGLEDNSMDRRSLVQLLGAQLPAGLEIVLRGDVLHNPDVVELALGLLATPPPAQRAAVSFRVGGAAPTQRTVVLQTLHPANSVQGMCAALAWHHIRARLMQRFGRSCKALDCLSIEPSGLSGLSYTEAFSRLFELSGGVSEEPEEPPCSDDSGDDEEDSDFPDIFMFSSDYSDPADQDDLNSACFDEADDEEVVESTRHIRRSWAKLGPPAYPAAHSEELQALLPAGWGV